MSKKVIDTSKFIEALHPIEILLGRKLNQYEIRNIYYTVFDSASDKDFKFIIEKYAQKFYFYNSLTDLEMQLIIDIFKKHELTHKDLDKAFKIRTQRVLAKARDWPTPAELIALVKPDAIVNIYDDNGRQKVLEGVTKDKIKEEKIDKMFKNVFATMRRE